MSRAKKVQETKELEPQVEDQPVITAELVQALLLVLQDSGSLIGLTKQKKLHQVLLDPDGDLILAVLPRARRQRLTALLKMVVVLFDTETVEQVNRSTAEVNSSKKNGKKAKKAK